MGLREWWNSLKQSGADQPKLEVTLRAGTYFQQEDPKITEARKAATAHAQMGDYVAAVAELERVRDLVARDGSPAECAREIRLAKYLQKAGRGDEAWQLFTALFEREKSDPWSLIDLLDAMRLHLQREDRAREAIRYGVAMRLAQVKLYRDWRREAEAALARPVQGYGDKELERLTRENQKGDVELCERWLSQLTNPRELTALAKPLCKKAGLPEQTEALVAELEAAIRKPTDPLDYLRAEGATE